MANWFMWSFITCLEELDWLDWTVEKDLEKDLYSYKIIVALWLCLSLAFDPTNALWVFQPLCMITHKVFLTVDKVNKHGCV